MNRQKVFQSLWVVSLFIVAGLGCKLVTSPGQIVGNAINTQVGVAVTQAGTSVGAVITGLSTQIESIATQMEGGIGEILGGGNQTPIGTVPADIPVMPSGTSIVASPTRVTYETDYGIQAIVTYYRGEMPKLGWVEVTAESRVLEGGATLVFQKGGKKATIKIEDMFISTSVTIEIVGT